MPPLPPRAAAIGDIGDHEGQVGDVARAEQEIARKIDQDRRNRKMRGTSFCRSGLAIEPGKQYRDDHHGAKQCRRPPQDPARARPVRPQHKGRNKTGGDDSEPGRGLVEANWNCSTVSNEPALYVFAVIDQDHHVVASLYRVEPKRRSGQHEVSRFQ